MKSTSRIGPDNWLLRRPIAHRGLHGVDVPENSLRAFERAATAGYPIELDVRLLNDGSVVVYHDTTVDRLTNAKGKLANFTRESIGPLRLMGGPDPIPLLVDVLDLVDGRVGLLIEIKNETASAGDLERRVVDTLKGYRGDFALQSFNALSVLYLKRYAPEMLRGQLCGRYRDYPLPGPVRTLMRGFQLSCPNQPDFIAYDFRSLPDADVDRRRAGGIPVIAWHVMSEADAAAAVDVADNIIFDGFLPRES